MYLFAEMDNPRFWIDTVAPIERPLRFRPNRACVLDPNFKQKGMYARPQDSNHYGSIARNHSRGLPKTGLRRGSRPGTHATAPESTIGYRRFHPGFWVGERSQQASTTGRPEPNRREKRDGAA